MALASGPCLLPAGDNFPGDKGGLFSPCLAQPRFALSQDQPRHSSGSDPGPGEELLPEPCPSLKAAHQLLPTGDPAHSFSVWRRHPRDTAPELHISVSGEQGRLFNT